ncbi:MULTISPECIES: hypothetical protein [Actinomyces]|uniref:Conjugal transfer protein TrbC n=1 Tax=Actinomyces marmotae TaxID=2737173 RepID=A0A6M8B890_9ACTO|nr:MULTISPECIES: hypothetical protein [Actinomyces]QKD79433.1 hypothetical protein HPC72_03460 [Actinomyces marmotae]
MSILNATGGYLLARAGEIQAGLAPMDPVVSTPPGVGAKVDLILGYLMWIAGSVAVAAFIIGGISIMFLGMGRGGDGLQRAAEILIYVFVGAAVVGAASALAKF